MTRAHIEVYRNASAAVRAAYDKAAFNLRSNQQRFNYKVFVLCGCEPGVGTTTAAVELSIAIAVSGASVALIDGNLRKENAFKRLNKAESPGIVEYIKGITGLDTIIQGTDWNGLSYIPCGDISVEGDEETTRLLYSQRMSYIMQTIRNQFNFAIIDCPAITTAVDTAAFSSLADAVVIVAAVDGTERKYLERAYEQLRSFGANVIGVIETKIERVEYKEYLNDFDYFQKKDFAENIMRKKFEQE